MNKGNILIVDDTADNLRILEALLSQEGYDVRAATSGAAALRVISIEQPELILLDIMMPHMNGFDVCRSLKKDKTTAGIPVIFISALKEVQEKVHAFHEGGVDYITKPFQQEEVLARVATHIELYRLRCQLEEMLIEQSKMAATDQLTGIYNRYKFELLFTQELERVKRYNTPLSLIMFDIDNFKTINDTYGHITGDVILQQITRIIKNLIRKADVFARWGGEEFLILCTETNIIDAEVLAEKLRRNIETTSFSKVSQITSSFGVTDYKNQESIEAFVNRVDNAMYQAKNEGKNKVVIV